MSEHLSKTIIDVSNDEWRAHLPKNFDFLAARHLIKELRQSGDMPLRLRLNFSQTQRIDHAGLGGLLCLAERYGEQAPIVAEKASNEVRNMLKIISVHGQLSIVS